MPNVNIIQTRQHCGSILPSPVMAASTVDTSSKSRALQHPSMPQCSMDLHVPYCAQMNLALCCTSDRN
eukprot:1904389-Pleurochrysis_carterae.AAC.4